LEKLERLLAESVDATVIRLGMLKLAGYEGDSSILVDEFPAAATKRIPAFIAL
jgi:hypothetical protein